MSSAPHLTDFPSCGQATHLRLTHQVAKVGSWSLDTGTGRLHWSPELCALLEVGSNYLPSLEEGLAFFLPSGRRRVRSALDRCLNEGIPFDVDAPARTARGNRIRLRTLGESVRPPGAAAAHIHGICQNVTSLHRMREALRIQEERFRLLASATNDAIWDWNLETDDVWWNDGVETLFGYRQEEVGTEMARWMAMIHPDDRAEVRASLTEAFKSRSTTWAGEHRFRRADGRWAWVLVRAQLVRNESGRVIRVVGGMTDLTSHHELEQQLARSRNLESLGRLAGGIAHDFNNALASILGSIELLLLDPPTDPQARADLEQVRQSARRGARLTGQLLALARRQVLRPERLVLNHLVEDGISTARPMLPRDIRLKFRPGGGMPPIVADARQLEAVLHQLLVNSAEAMPDGGTILVETMVEEPVKPDGMPLVVLRVRDHGVGMDDTTLERAFDPFFTTKSEPGAGLGLAAVHGTIIQSGGTVDVESTPGVGSTFTVRLPTEHTEPPMAEGVR
ncbi:MAG: PAS domain-containing sensor histidine kinase [Gemmatimonadales bacterium]|nr:MAG: PAS domain-containing sensor histidine kinase [Gemmatimonadales bacterium]